MKYLIILLFSLLNFIDAFGAIRVDTESFPGRIKIFVDLNLTEVNKLADVDILYTIDDSGSMDPYQKQLSINAEKIRQELSQLNSEYHVGVITTDMSSVHQSGRLQGNPPFIYPRFPDTANWLSRTLLVGTAGSPYERPFDAILAALSPSLLNTSNYGFLRDDAKLYILVISDAVDQSSVKYPDFVQQLIQIKGNKDKILMDGILFTSQSPQHDPHCQNDYIRTTQDPINLEMAVAEFGGKVFDICSNNYERHFSSLSERLIEFLADGLSTPPILSTLIRSVPFPMPPRLSTLTVQYGNQVIPAGHLEKGWVYKESEQVLLLGAKIPWTLQPPGTELEITYIPEEWAQ